MRWTSLNSNLVVAANVRHKVGVLGEFLTFKLLEDYVDRPYAPAEDMLFVIDEFVKIAGKPVDYPFTLKEMALNTKWVEGKLATVAAKRGKPSNDVQTLIHEHDWPQLATTLVNDREMATELFKESLCTQDSYERIIKGIIYVQTSYFEELQSPTEYVLNARAPQLKDETPYDPNLFSQIIAQFWRSNRRPRPAIDGFQLLQKVPESLKKSN